MSRIGGFVSSTADYPSAERLAEIARGLGRYPSVIEQLTGRAALVAVGAEPAAASVDGVRVVLDGRIYNRAELPAGSDAEIVARLYRNHGISGALSRINGDFALAVFDEREGTLFLARDRFGSKPLYFAETAEGLAFASRPRALWDVVPSSRAVNPRWTAVFAASHYRYIDNAPGESPYEGIEQLPAAHFLEWRPGRRRLERYWALRDEADFGEDEETLAEAYRELLLDAVRIRLAAADRPTFTLSGGMDSSSVLSSAVHVAGRKWDAFSTVYDDRTYDESDEIATILDDATTAWHPVRVGTPPVFELVREMIAANDEPVATATWLPHYILCRSVRDLGFRDVFGGLGGDELNAGEYEYFLYHFADLRAAGEEKALGREIGKWMEYHDHPVFRKTPAVVEEGFARLTDLADPGRCLPDRGRLTRYYRALSPDFYPLETFDPVMERPFRSYLKNRTYHDLTRETLPCCLRAQDRHAEHFGLDNVLPFLDHRLVEFMYRVPGPLKIHDGVTKRLLRTATRDILPEDTRTRIKKTGWNAPAHVWFSGGGRSDLLDLVHSRAFRERGVYDVAEVSRIIDEHERIMASGAPAENHMMFLWQLVNTELWLQMLDDPAATPEDGRSLESAVSE